MFDIYQLLLSIPALLIALTFHEYAHARMAYAWGDQTAKQAGRLTLNPLSHLDPIGTLMLLIARFGWAKPVPINPNYFRDVNKGIFWVSLAGPGMNMILAVLATILLVFFPNHNTYFYWILYYLQLYNVYLAIFNLLPLPPLDGSKILLALLPPEHRYIYYNIEPYGPFILIALVFLGVFRRVLVPVAEATITSLNKLFEFLLGMV